jgi:hypothetical protein
MYGIRPTFNTFEGIPVLNSQSPMKKIIDLNRSWANFELGRCAVTENCYIIGT